ncbi:MAG: hypothetical protein D3922_10380 [Candidatus Electrothrix sp. AR1]|nr:hypothetical protein [Candidatus Electrothrix sp. AR1]
MKLKDILKRVDSNILISILGIVAAVCSLIVTVATPEVRSFLSIELADQTTEGQYQIQQLNEVESTIKKLLFFVEAQRRKVRETEETLSILESEKNKLQPVVEANRATIEAVFRLQEERNAANVLRERLIGFFLGVISSLLASLVWLVINSRVTKRGEKKMQQQHTDPQNSQNP